MSTIDGRQTDAEVVLTDIDHRVDADIEWSPHAKQRWDERGGGVGYLRAFVTAEEIHYPSAYDNCRGRYHEASDSVLIVKRVRRREHAMGWQIVDIIRSVIDCADREGKSAIVDGDRVDEAAYVRGQV